MKRIFTCLLILSSLLLFTSCERNSLSKYIHENTSEESTDDSADDSIDDSTDDPVEEIIKKIYVSATGSDAAGDGSKTSPYATIQHAIDSAPSSYAVCVAAGTYNVTTPIIMKSGVPVLGGFDPLTWERGAYQTESDRSANPTIINYTGSDTGVNFLNPVRTVEFSSSDIGSNTYIEGFIINGKSSAAAPCAIFVLNGASPVIRYNTINGGVGTGTHAWAVIAAGGSNPSILNNRINAPTGASSNTYSVYVYESFSTIKGNDLYTYSSATPDQCVIQAYYNSDVIIDSNNINLGNGSSTNTGIRIDTPATAATITNNTLSGSSKDFMGIYSSCSGTVIRNNEIYIAGSGSSNGIRLNGATSAVVESNNITDTGSMASEVSGIIIYGSSSSSTIRRNIIVLTAANTTTSCICDASESSGNNIYSNFLNANGAFGTLGAGINVYKSSPAIVNNTILTNNTGSGESVCIYLWGTITLSTPAIINNIMSAKGSSSNFYGVHEASADTDPTNVRNNLFMDCATAFYRDEDTTNLINATAVNALSGGTTASGNIEPVITITGTGVVDPGNWADIDSAGFDISGSYSGAMIDLAGAARVVPLTIGAYEY